MRIRTPLDLGLIIRDRRRKLGLSQSRLSEKAGVGRQWLVAVERGKVRAEIGLVLRTLATLDLTLSADGNGQDRKAASDRRRANSATGISEVTNNCSAQRRTVSPG